MADSLVEGTETVTITLDTITASDPGITIGTASDSIDILDGDSATVSIAGTTDGNETGPVTGVFTVTQTATAVSDTVIDYTVTGIGDRRHRLRQPSRHGHDPAGTTSQTIDISNIVADSLVEGTETVIITLDTITASDPGITIGTASDSIDILDGDSATVSIAGTTDGNETGPVTGVFTVTQTATAVSDTVIDYTVTGSATEGTDYDSLSGTVTIPAGSTSQTIDISNIVADSLVEGTETVVITLDAITARDPGITIGTASDSIDILDGDSATVSIAGTTDGNETGPVTGVFTVTQTATAVSDTVIDYTVTGTRPKAPTTTACPAPSRSRPVHQSRPSISATSWPTPWWKAPRRSSITLDTITARDPGITIGTASDSIDILDGDSATVSIAGTTDGNETGPVTGVFTVTQTATAVSDTVIDYTVTGTATEGTDYDSLSGTVTIPAGTTSQTIDISNIVADTLVEGTETVIDHAGYDHGE